MSPDDKALLSVLLDDEASPDEISLALELLERKPELLSYLDQQQWLRVHWQKEYAGPQLDLRGGIWDKIAEEDAASEAGLVDELALRREARGLAKAISGTASPAETEEKAELEQVMAQSADAQTASIYSGQSTEQSVVEAVNDKRVQKRWWQPMAQVAVAASVCFGVVGLWYFEQPSTAVTPAVEATLATNQLANESNILVASSVPFNGDVASSPTAQARRFLENNPLPGAALAGLESAPQSTPSVVVPTVPQGVVAGPQVAVQPQSVPEMINFVSLDSLAERERARLQSYYMMHTGNSALMQPGKGMQLVRIVDTPPAPQLRTANGGQ